MSNYGRVKNNTKYKNDGNTLLYFGIWIYFVPKMYDSFNLFISISPRTKIMGAPSKQ